VVLLLDPLGASLRIQLAEEAVGSVALEFSAVGRWRDNGLRGGWMSLRHGEAVVLPAIESEIHVDLKDVGIARVRPRAVLVLRVGALDKAGSILGVGIEDGDVQIVNVAQVEVNERVEFVITYGGHVVGPRRASRGVHGMGDDAKTGEPVGQAEELQMDKLSKAEAWEVLHMAAGPYD